MVNSSIRDLACGHPIHACGGLPGRRHSLSGHDGFFIGATLRRLREIVSDIQYVRLSIPPWDDVRLPCLELGATLSLEHNDASLSVNERAFQPCPPGHPARPHPD